MLRGAVWGASFSPLLQTRPPKIRCMNPTSGKTIFRRTSSNAWSRVRTPTGTSRTAIWSSRLPSLTTTLSQTMLTSVKSQSIPFTTTLRPCSGTGRAQPLHMAQPLSYYACKPYMHGSTAMSHDTILSRVILTRWQMTHHDFCTTPNKNFFLTLTNIFLSRDLGSYAH